MKKLFLALLLFTLTMHSQTTVNYLPINDVGANTIRNPERGMYIQISTKPSPAPLPFYYTLSAQYPNGITLPDHVSLIRRIIRLDDFRNVQDLTPEFLANIQSDLTFLRTNNLKCVLLFCYSDTNTYPNPPGPPSNPIYEPSTIANIKHHIDQINDITALAINEAVISSVEAGFIGISGEWATTSTGSVFGNGTLSQSNLDARKEIGNEIMTLCPNRLVAFRTPRFQRLMMGQIPSTVITLPVINNRIAAYNDCFLRNDTDAGTYAPGGADQIFLEGQSINTFDGGETCEPSTFSIGSNALIQMRRFHFNYLNATFNEAVISNWNTTYLPKSSVSYFDEIRRRLGYRFVLSSSIVSGNTITINLQNLGYANVFNQRRAFLVLRNTSNVVVARVELTNSNSDVRSWSVAPIPTATIPSPVTPTITLTKNLTGYVCAGSYRLSLELPDNDATLINPNYSIRLPNAVNGQDVWEANTGFNNLYQTINITAPPIPTITGSVSACTASNLTYQTTNSTTLLPGQTANWTIEPPINGTFVNGSNTTTTAIVNWTTLPATLRLTVTLPGGCTTVTTRTITSICTQCDCLDNFTWLQTPNTDQYCTLNNNSASICQGLNLRYIWNYSNQTAIMTLAPNNCYTKKNNTGVRLELIDSNSQIICTKILGIAFRQNQNLYNSIKLIKVSPNPSTGNYNIKIENYVGELNIKVYDLNGRLVYDEKENKFDNETMIDLSHFQSGMYLLKIEGENINYSQKVIKN